MYIFDQKSAGACCSYVVLFNDKINVFYIFECFVCTDELHAMDSLGEIIHFIQNPPVRL